MEDPQNQGSGPRAGQVLLGDVPVGEDNDATPCSISGGQALPRVLPSPGGAAKLDPPQRKTPGNGHFHCEKPPWAKPGCSGQIWVVPSAPLCAAKAPS